MRLTGLFLLCLGVLSGCNPDPEATFEEFEKRTAERARNKAEAGMNMMEGDGGTCDPPSTEAMAGTYIFAVRPTFAMDVLIMSRLTLEPIAGKDDELKMTLLSLAQKGHEPVPGYEPFETTLKLDGNKFYMDTVTVTVPGEANPAGFDSKSSLSFRGTWCAPENGSVTSFCGIADGMVTEPVTADYTGSPFGAQRANENGDLPEPASECVTGSKTK